MRKQFAPTGLFADTAIYGASWTKVASPTLTRTDGAVGLVANVGVDDEVVRNDFNAVPIFGEMTEVTDVYNNKFIRIPKFYIKKVDTANFKSWQVSKTQHNGFYLPWCFWDFTNSQELDYFYIGKYKASLDGIRLASVSGEPPLVNTHIVDFRTYAQNNNTGGLLGYQQLDIHTVDILRTLMFIEFATLNMQTIMYGFANGRYGQETELATDDTVDDNYIDVSNATGANYRVGQTISVGTARYGTQIFYGRTITAINADTPSAGTTRITFDGDPVSISTGNFLQNTGAISGFSGDIVASSGSPVSNSDGKYPCMYRGIESPYGDIWQFVDGVNISPTGDLRRAWVCADAGDYASNVFASPYEQIGYVNHDANYYVQAMGWDENYPYAVFPVSVQNSSVEYYCDYYYQSDSVNRVALVGGNWYFGSAAGPSFWRLNDSSGSAALSLGGRLCRKGL